VHLEVRPAGPAERARLCSTLEVGAAIVAVPEATATWRVPLGLAAKTPFPAPTVFLETLRVGRLRTQARRRILVQPEDHVAHVRDPLARACSAAGLAPAQVVLAPSLVDAAAAVLGSPDLLLCSREQADDFALHWSPIEDPQLVRGYRVTAGACEDTDALGSLLDADIAHCLGAPTGVPQGGSDPGQATSGHAT
jgi:hypothetical protein